MTYLLSQLKNGLSCKLSWSQNSQNLQFAYSFTSALSTAKCRSGYRVRQARQLTDFSFNRHNDICL